MTTIGTDDIPGIQTTVNTADTVGTGAEAPTDVCLVGPADSTATNYPGDNEVEAMRTAADAREMFGETADSMLTGAVFNAFGEGAMPVYGVAPEAVQVTGEDISGLGQASGTLENAPVSEDPSDTTFTVDGSDKNTVITLDDPSNKTVSANEVYLNPVTGDFKLDATNGDSDDTNDTVDYTQFDYESALDAVAEQRGDTVDFIAPLQENVDVTNYALQTVNNMESFYDLATALCGLLPETSVSADMSSAVTWDDSRLQVAYPSRNVDGDNAMGAWAGKKASLGLDASAMGKALSTMGRMRTRISVQDEIDLTNNNVVAIRSATGGARLVDDPTTVTDQNSEEAGMRQGYSRLVIDSVIEMTKENEQPFIGRFNNDETQNALKNLLTERMEEMLTENTVEDYSVVVREKDALSAKVDITVDTADPLRNIYNTISAGQTS